jgi:hypothetical protein
MMPLPRGHFRQESPVGSQVLAMTLPELLAGRGTAKIRWVASKKTAIIEAIDADQISRERAIALLPLTQRLWHAGAPNHSAAIERL